MSRVEGQDFLETVSIFNFMNLVYDLMEIYGFKPSEKVVEKETIYFKTYQIVRKKWYIGINWSTGVNNHYIKLRTAPFRVRLLNNFYFYLMGRISTSDESHYANVVRLVFGYFKEYFQLKYVDFSNVTNGTDSQIQVLYSLYKNYFMKTNTIENFIQYFNIGESLGNLLKEFDNQYQTTAEYVELHNSLLTQ